VGRGSKGGRGPLGLGWVDTLDSVSGGHGSVEGKQGSEGGHPRAVEELEDEVEGLKVRMCGRLGEGTEYTCVLSLEGRGSLHAHKPKARCRLSITASCFNRSTLPPPAP
jgi:hypothetical protein